MILTDLDTLSSASMFRRTMLSSSRSLAFLDALRPPVEAGGRADEVRMRLQSDTACRLGVFELVDRDEMAIGQRRVRQRSEVLGWLQLRRVGG